VWFHLGVTTLLLGTYPSHVYSFLRGNHGILQNMKSNIISYLVIASFCFAVFLGASKTQITPEPIFNLDTSKKIDFHTPLLNHGTTLPLHIISDTTVGPSDGIILVNTVITVEKGASLTILPGTTLAISEFGGLNIFGNINAIGTTDKPISFITNELNETNRHWVGLLLQNSSNANLQYLIIHHASPAISCAPRTQTHISNISFLLDAVGFARNTAGCTIL
jgi:hypothetical protein